MSSAPVPVVTPPQPPEAQTLTCANCGAALAGEYCSACGQRHEPHVHTISHFAAEAFESLTHADSRVWKTLGYLLARPGLLTREFLDGRRARYLPPFRLYIVISLVFFLVGMPGHVNVKPQEPSETLDSKTLLEQAHQVEAADSAIPESIRKRSAEYLREEAAKAAAREARGEKPKAAKPAAGAAADDADDTDEDTGATHNNVNMNIGGLNSFCDSLDKPDSSFSLFRDNLRARCKRLAASDGSELGNTFIHNVPRAMFVFLPLLALIMMLMYWRPKRYYVEHLLFMIHNHAFVFLAATILILLARIPFLEAITGWLVFAGICYMVWYIYRAMRNVYGQGRALTLAKYSTLVFVYVAMSSIMLVLTVLYSALTV
jgi:uncharacterized protein DUF3667